MIDSFVIFIIHRKSKNINNQNTNSCKNNTIGSNLHVEYKPGQFPRPGFLLSAPGGARFLRVKVPNPPGSGKDIAEGKGVYREVESEGSRMWEQTNHGQISGLTNRNLI